jgi:hypothetical protein
MSLPMLAARLAGGFARPAQAEELDPAIQSALDTSGFREFEQIRELPGTRRAVARTLAKAWDADVTLDALRGQSDRLSDLALIEERIRSALPSGVLTPSELRDAALARIHFAPAVLGPVTLERLTAVPPVWRPVLRALADVVQVTWRNPGTGDRAWFSGVVTIDEAQRPAAFDVVSCSGPHAEVVESLRWARELITSGDAQPGQIGVAAPSTREWDDHFLALSESAGLPLHFSHGVPALATQDGQACAALADVLVNGLSQDRIRRIVAHAAGRAKALEGLPEKWSAGLDRGAALFEVEQWRKALARGGLSEAARVLMPVIDLPRKGL